MNKSLLFQNKNLNIPQKPYWLLTFSLLGFYALYRYSSDRPLLCLFFLLTGTLFCLGQIIPLLVKIFEKPYYPSPHRTTLMNIETEVIQRFRLLVPFLPSQCLVFRQIEDNSILLCLDFTNCPDALSSNLERFHLLVAASTSLGLAKSLVFKLHGSIVHKFILS